MFPFVCQSLTREAASKGDILYDDFLYSEIIFRWLQACSTSPVRVWRKTATLTTFAIMESLNQLAMELHERMEVLQKQIGDKAIKKAKAQELKEEFENVNTHIDVVQTLLKTGFDK